jgi:hypothetical protein
VNDDIENLFELGFELQRLAAHGILITTCSGDPHVYPALLILETRPACGQAMKRLGCLALACLRGLMG